MAGITVTAFSSLSLDPPLVLVCIDKRAKLHDHFQRGGAYAVNILAQDQEFVSRRFASSGPDQFKEIGYSLGATGAPLLQGTVCGIECRIVDVLPAATTRSWLVRSNRRGSTTPSRCVISAAGTRGCRRAS